MAGEERPCEVCGQYAAREDLRPFTYQSNGRVFRGPARAHPGEAGGPVYEKQSVTRVEMVCERCAETLAAGAPASALRGRRALLQMALFCVVLLLIVVLTPLLLPIFMSALWLR